MCRETALYNAYTFCEAVVQPFPARCKLVMYAGRADSDPGNILEQGNWATESQVTVPPMQIPVSGQMTDVQVHLQVLLQDDFYQKSRSMDNCNSSPPKPGELGSSAAAFVVFPATAPKPVAVTAPARSNSCDCHRTGQAHSASAV